MEITLESREHLHWQSNLKRFYIIKSLSIIITFIFIVCTSFILYQDNDKYPECNLIGDEDNIGSRIRAAMVMLLIYHIFELISLIHEVLTVKNIDGGGKARSILKLN